MSDFLCNFALHYMVIQGKFYGFKYTDSTPVALPGIKNNQKT